MGVKVRQVHVAKKTSISDSVIFMAAYNIDKISKNFPQIWKRKKVKELLKLHHITAIVSNNIILTPESRLSYAEEFCYVNQETKFSYGNNNKKDKIDDHLEELSKCSWILSLRHSAHLLLDESLFKISFLIDMAPFLVSIGSKILEVKAFAFFMNGVIFINYELTDLMTKKPFDRRKCKGVKSNYNILPIEKIKYLDGEDFITDNRKISDVIFDNIVECFTDIMRKKYRTKSFSFLHNTFIVTKQGLDVEAYIQRAIGADIPDLQLQNLSSTKDFGYYSYDSFGIIAGCSKDILRQVLFDGILLESVKMYLCLQPVLGVHEIDNLEKLLHQRDYIECLRYPSHVPIITDNALKAFTNTNSFIQYTSALDLKIHYFSILEDQKKAKNGRLLNLLLYLLAVVNSIGALGTLHSELNLSFIGGLVAVVLIFGALGAYWFFKDKRK